MSNKRITDLTELTTPTTDDVFPVVDIATNTTTKVQLGNLPTTTAVTTALATKQDTLVSGTNIKTVNSTSLLGSGNVAVQETLVSGTNIKTLNSTSLLGSGNITIAANPSGVAGAIQFSNGSAFASDAANLFWDDTNNRLGVGTNAPTTSLQIDYASSSLNGILINQTGGANNFSSIGFANNGTIRSTFGMNLNTGEVRWFNNSGGYFATIYSNGVEAMRIDGSQNVNIGATALGARLGIKGSGSTLATTSLLVQNSAGSELAKFNDDGSISFGSKLNVSTIGTINASGNVYALGGSSVQVTAAGNFRFVVGSVISNSSDGVLMLSDFAMSTFNRLQFGGTSASFPSLKRALNNFEVKNADDTFGAGISVGGTLVASAILQADSTTKGFLPPRMTTTQKNAIATPASGLVVYDTTTNKLCCYNGSTWNDLF